MPPAESYDTFAKMKRGVVTARDKRAYKLMKARRRMKKRAQRLVLPRGHAG